MKEVMQPQEIKESPRCPKCGFVMCEQFDTERVNDGAELATPNGTYICYGCGITTEQEIKSQGEAGKAPSLSTDRISKDIQLGDAGRVYQRRLYDECVTAGWDAARLNTFSEEIAHLHEELSEAFREFRRHKNFKIRYRADGKPEGIPIELADVLIGLFYNAELHGFNLFDAVEEKHRYNLTRDYGAEGRQLHPTPQPPITPQVEATATAAALSQDVPEHGPASLPESDSLSDDTAEGSVHPDTYSPNARHCAVCTAKVGRATFHLPPLCASPESGVSTLRPESDKRPYELHHPSEIESLRSELEAAQKRIAELDNEGDRLAERNHALNEENELLESEGREARAQLGRQIREAVEARLAAGSTNREDDFNLGVRAAVAAIDRVLSPPENQQK